MTVPPASRRDLGSGRRRNPAGTSSSPGPGPAGASAAFGCWLVPFATSQDYYERVAGPSRPPTGRRYYRQVLRGGDVVVLRGRRVPGVVVVMADQRERVGMPGGDRCGH